MEKSLYYHPGKSMSDKEVTKDLKIMEVVGDLYSLNPFQCSICGMRYQHNSQLKEHLDEYHFVQKRSQYESEYFGGRCQNTRKSFASLKEFMGENSKIGDD